LIGYILMGLYIISCLILILFVLLQPGKSDAAAVFGGGANSSAFGPRGTQTVLAKVTIGAAVVFFLIAFLFSIPGLFGERSVGEGVGPAQEPPPVTTPATPETAPSPAAPAAAPSPAAGENQPAGQGTQKQNAPAQPTASPRQP
jgi:preprotein translocase subunit SecG